LLLMSKAKNMIVTTLLTFSCFKVNALSSFMHLFQVFSSVGQSNSVGRIYTYEKHVRVNNVSSKRRGGEERAARISAKN
jgi:hypothetical protein